jgi:hypothetical protein
MLRRNQEQGTLSNAGNTTLKLAKYFNYSLIDMIYISILTRPARQCLYSESFLELICSHTFARDRVS